MAFIRNKEAIPGDLRRVHRKYIQFIDIYAQTEETKNPTWAYEKGGWHGIIKVSKVFNHY